RAELVLREAIEVFPVQPLPLDAEVPEVLELERAAQARAPRGVVARRHHRGPRGTSRTPVGPGAPMGPLDPGLAVEALAVELQGDLPIGDEPVGRRLEARGRVLAARPGVPCDAGLEADAAELTRRELEAP